MYIRNSIMFERRLDLEAINTNVIIIDLQEGRRKKCIVNIYRSFNPQEATPRELFIKQCDLMKVAFYTETVILGDMNLDYNTKFDVNYQHYHLFELYEDRMGQFNLMQLVKFDTRGRFHKLYLRSMPLQKS